MLVIGMLDAPMLAIANPVVSKNRPRPGNPPELKRLEAKAEEIRESFLRDTNQLIKQFEDVGQFEKAKVLVDALAKLDPLNEPVKTKLDELSTKILDAGEFELALNPGKSWQPVGTVERGQTVPAFAASVGAQAAINGDFFSLDGNFWPDGLAAHDVVPAGGEQRIAARRGDSLGIVLPERARVVGERALGG
ncbi:hypothetical protein EBR56_09980, partial [bacterium]|nr:hypothetical protein [bacterium]